MAKFIFTESQIEKIKQTISEDSTQGDYEMECGVNLEYYGLRYKGREINYISGVENTTSSFRLTYGIDIEYRKYGIKSIGIYGVSGPSEIELEVEYFLNEDNTRIARFTLPLNWNEDDTVESEYETGGFIGLDDEITIVLKNDEYGGIDIEKIKITKYTI